MEEPKSRRGLFSRLGGRRSGSKKSQQQPDPASRRQLPGYRSTAQSENEIWVANTDPETGTKYYTNTANGVRSWERPTGAVSVVDGSSLETAVVNAAVAVEEAPGKNSGSELEPRINAIQPVTLNQSLRNLRQQNAIFDAEKLANARVKTIDDILNLLGLHAKIPVFHSEGIDLAALFYVTDQSLQEVGLSLGERIKLLKVVELLREMPELSSYSRPLQASNIPVPQPSQPVHTKRSKSHSGSRSKSRRRSRSSSLDTDSEFEEAVLEALGKRRSRRRHGRSNSRSRSPKSSSRKSKHRSKDRDRDRSEPSSSFKQPTPPPMPPPSYTPNPAPAPQGSASPWTQLAGSNGFAAAALGSVFGTMMLSKGKSDVGEVSRSTATTQVELVKSLLDAEKRLAEERMKQQELRLEQRAQALEEKMAQKETDFQKRQLEIERENSRLRKEAELAQEEARAAADAARLEEKRRLSELEDRLEQEKAQLAMRQIEQEAKQLESEVEPSPEPLSEGERKAKGSGKKQKKKRQSRRAFEIDEVPPGDVEFMLEEQRTKVALKERRRLESELLDLESESVQGDLVREQAILRLEEERVRHETELAVEKSRLEHELEMERMAFAAEKAALIAEMADLEEMRSLESLQRVERDRFLERHAESIREELVQDQQAHAALMQQVEARRLENEAAKLRLEEEAKRQEIEQLEVDDKVVRAKELVIAEQHRVEKETERIREEQRLRALKANDEQMRLEAVMAAQAPSDSSEASDEDDEDSLPNLELLEALQGVTLSSIARQAAVVALKKSIIEAELELEFSTTDEESVLPDSDDEGQRWPQFFILPEDLQDAMLRLKPVEERMSLADLSEGASLSSGVLRDFDHVDAGVDTVPKEQEEQESRDSDVEHEAVVKYSDEEEKEEEEEVDKRSREAGSLHSTSDVDLGVRSVSTGEELSLGDAVEHDDTRREGSLEDSDDSIERIARQMVSESESSEVRQNGQLDENLRKLGSSGDDELDWDISSEEKQRSELASGDETLEVAEEKGGASDASSRGISLGSPGSALRTDSDSDSDADDEGESSENTDEANSDSGYRRGSYDSGAFAGEIFNEFIDEMDTVDDLEFLQTLLHAQRYRQTEAAAHDLSETASSTAEDDQSEGSQREFHYEGVTIEVLESSADEQPPTAPLQAQEAAKDVRLDDAKPTDDTLLHQVRKPHVAGENVKSSRRVERSMNTAMLSFTEELRETEVRMVLRKMLLKLERMDAMGDLDPSLEATYERGSGVPVLQTLRGLVTEQVEESMSWTSSDYLELEGKVKSSAVAYTSLAAQAASAGKERLYKREQQAHAGVDTELPIHLATVSPMLKKNIFSSETEMHLQPFSDFDDSPRAGENFLGDGVIRSTEGDEHKIKEEGHDEHETRDVPVMMSSDDDDDDSLDKESSVSYNRYTKERSSAVTSSSRGTADEEAGAPMSVSLSAVERDGEQHSIQSSSQHSSLSQRESAPPRDSGSLGSPKHAKDDGRQGAGEPDDDESGNAVQQQSHQAGAYASPTTVESGSNASGDRRNAEEPEIDTGSHGDQNVSHLNLAEPEGEDGIHASSVEAKNLAQPEKFHEGESNPVPIKAFAHVVEQPLQKIKPIKTQIPVQRVAKLSFGGDAERTTNTLVDTLSEVSSVLSDSSGYMSEFVDENLESSMEYGTYGVQRSERAPSDTRLQIFGTLPNADAQRLKPQLSVALEKAVAPLQSVEMKYAGAKVSADAEALSGHSMTVTKEKSHGASSALLGAGYIDKDVALELAEVSSSSETSAYSSLSFSESSSGSARSLGSIKASEIKVISNVVTTTVRRIPDEK